MKTLRRGYIHYGIAVLFLVLFALVWSSSNLYYHTHLYGNELVTHSHPYSHNSSHSHSYSETQIIQHASSMLMLLTLALIAITLYRVTEKSLNVGRFHHFNSFVGHCRLLRAPPAVLSI